MNQAGEFLSQLFLENTKVFISPMLLYQVIDFIPWQKSKNLKKPFCILIGCIEPELIKTVRGSFISAEPYISFFTFTKFGAIGLCQQGTCKCKSFASAFTPY